MILKLYMSLICLTYKTLVSCDLCWAETRLLTVVVALE